MYINYNEYFTDYSGSEDVKEHWAKQKVLFYKSHNKRQLLQIIGFKSLKVLDLL